jgi:hypothetical protein
MAENHAGRVADQIRTAVKQRQAGMLHRMIGKYVVRDGVMFLVVSVNWGRGKVTVSDVKTPRVQTTKFSVGSFLSKAIRIVEDEKKKEKEEETE